MVELRDSDQRHRRILESAVDYAIISMDLSGRVTRWNEGAYRILGWTEDEMLGRRYDAFFTPEDMDAHIPEIEMSKALTQGLGDDERWHLRKDGSRFWASGRMAPLTDEAGAPIGFLRMIRDRTDMRLAQEAVTATEQAAETHRRLLTDELEHRVKNTLSLVQAIVTQTLRTATTPADARTAIDLRLVSLGRAHSLLTQSRWSAVPIGEIIKAATLVHGATTDRIRASGPDMMIKSRPALGLSMALHELCTNAAKYGALSVEGGHVEIVWSIEGPDDAQVFQLVWQEVGGPTVAPPTRKGFGSRLIKASLAGDMEGVGAVEYLPHGVRWSARSALDHVRD